MSPSQYHTVSCRFLPSTAFRPISAAHTARSTLLRHPFGLPHHPKMIYLINLASPRRPVRNVVGVNTYRQCGRCPQ